MSYTPFVTPPDGYPYLSASISVGSGNHSAAAIYQDNGNACTEFGKDLTHLASDRWCSSDGGLVSVSCLPGNTRYYVQYGTANNFGGCNGGGHSGTYDIAINTGVFENDDLCTADLLTSNLGFSPISRPFESNRCASYAVNEPTASLGDETVWYSFQTGDTVGSNIRVNINSVADFNAEVAVYAICSGTCSYDNLSPVKYRTIYFSNNTRTDFHPTPNTTYYVQIWGQFVNPFGITGDDVGDFGLEILMTGNRPPNDDICAAIDLDVLDLGGSFSGSGTNVDATSELLCARNEINTHINGYDQTVWYKFTTSATPGTEIEIDIDITNTDACAPGVGVFLLNTAATTIDCPTNTLNTFTQLTEIATNGTFDPIGIVTIDCPMPNETYYIQVKTVGDCIESPFTYSVIDNGAQITHDDLCSADLLTSNLGFLPISRLFESNRCASYAVNEPTASLGDETVWYSFQTGDTVGNRIRIEVNSIADFNAELGVYVICEGTCSYSNLSLIRYSSLDFHYVAIATIQPAPNTTYYLQVWGQSDNSIGIVGDDVGDFDLQVHMTRIRPENDDICAAIDLDVLDLGGSFIGSGTNVNATAEQLCSKDEPNTTAGNPTVWYKFTTSATPGSEIEIDIDMTGFCSSSPRAGVFLLNTGATTIDCPTNTLNTFTQLTEIDVNDPNDITGIVTIDCPIPNETYYIQVKTVGDCIESPFTYSVIDNGAQITHDDLCSADLLTSNLGFSPISRLFESNRCASYAVNEPTASLGDETVWYSFQTGDTVGGNIRVNINSVADFNAEVAVYAICSGTCSYDNLSPVKYRTIYFSNNTRTDFHPTPNTTYYVQIWGQFVNPFGITGDDVGDFGLEILMTGNKPANDDICAAIDLDVLELGGSFSGSGTNVGATSELLCARNEINTHINGYDQTVWYKFTTSATPGTEIEIDIDVTDINNCAPNVGVFLLNTDETTIDCPTNTLNTFTQLTEIATNDFNDLIGIVTIDCPIPNETYYIQVKVGGDCVEDPFTYSVIDNGEQTAHDDLCSSDLLTSNLGFLPITRFFESNRCANYSVDEPTASPGDETVWYSFQTGDTVGNRIRIEVNSIADFNAELGVYVICEGACSYDNLSLIRYVNLNFHYFAIATIQPAPNTTYYLQVWGQSDNSIGIVGDDVGDFDLRVHMTRVRPENDDICAAIDLDVLDLGGSFFGSGTNVNATAEQLCSKDEPNTIVNDPTVWYKFTTSATPGTEIEIDIDMTVNCSPSAGVFLLNTAATTIDCPTNTSNTFTQLTEIAVNDFNDHTGIVTIDCPMPNETYYIQVKGRGDCNQAPFTYSVTDNGNECGRRDWIYAGLGTTISNSFCEEPDGWRHYYNDNGTPSNNNDDALLLSIFLNGNDFEGIATVDLLPAFTAKIDGTEAATYSMRRYWNFEITSGAINPAFPVGVRFYYLDAEKNEIITAAQNFATTNGLQYEPFEWFKTDDGIDFHPRLVHPRYIDLIGWSETGQFTPNIFADTPDGPGQGAQDFDEDNQNRQCNGVQYVEMQGLTGFSGGTGATGVSDEIGSPLPVELVSFEGWNDSDKNELEWRTASEINNEVFAVERSLDAINFDEFGYVAGNGTTIEEHT